MTALIQNSTLKASIVHFGQCIQAALLYRSALLIFLLTESFAYAGFIAFWYQAARQNTSQTAYTGLGLVAYFVIVSFHHAIQDHSAARDIGSEIRLGKLSYAIVRPFPYLLSATLRSLAFMVTRIILLLPLLLIALLVVPGLYNTIHATQFIDLLWQYPLTLGLAVASAIATRIVIGLIAFDMSQIWGPDTMLIAIYFATSGSAFPIDLAPPWLLQFAQWTPTYYMTGFPTLVFLGKISPEHFISEWLQGACVTMIVITAVGFMWQRGIKRFEAIGI